MATPRFEPEPCPFIGQPCEYVPMAHRMVRLEKEIERLRNKVQWLELVEATVVKQDKKIERLREALRFYADPLNYEQDMDAGEKARAALKGAE